MDVRLHIIVLNTHMCYLYLILTGWDNLYFQGDEPVVEDDDDEEEEDDDDEDDKDDDAEGMLKF